MKNRLWTIRLRLVAMVVLAAVAGLAASAQAAPGAAARLSVRFDDRASMLVGRFMVDRSGGCRARFNLPASHTWSRFWVTELGKPAAVVATT